MEFVLEAHYYYNYNRSLLSLNRKKFEPNHRNAKKPKSNVLYQIDWIYFERKRTKIDFFNPITSSIFLCHFAFLYLHGFGPTIALYFVVCVLGFVVRFHKMLQKEIGDCFTAYAKWIRKSATGKLWAQYYSRDLSTAISNIKRINHLTKVDKTERTDGNKSENLIFAYNLTLIIVPIARMNINSVYRTLKFVGNI